MFSKSLDIGSPYIPELVDVFMKGDPAIRGFVDWDPTLDAASAYAKKRIFSSEKRDVLVWVLSDQYARIGWSKQIVLDNIASLKSVDTFTITTWQQVHAFLWPVFFVTKILDCITTAQAASNNSDSQKFVPVFWMATEDHDFAEVSTVSIYNTPFVWETAGVGWPVWRLSPTWLVAMAQALRERLDDTALHAKYMDLFTYAYTHFSTLGQATHYLLDALFGDKGLVVIDGDDKQLKALFAPIMSADIFSQNSYPAIVQQTEKLTTFWLKKQAHPREINVFFMTDGHRGRIISDGDMYTVDGSDLRFSVADLTEKISTSPESFSPNVFLRPLYQETVLPNILYIPWPAELNYWLQMKELFAVHGLIMPVIIPRTFNQFLSSKNYEKITEWPIDMDTYFSSYDVFLDEIKRIDADTLSDTQDLIVILEKDVTAMQHNFATKRITHKRIHRSLEVINQEIVNLRHVIDGARTLALEESENYAPYIKIKQKFFSLEDRFERQNFVVGQLSVIDAMLHQETVSSSLGKLLLYIYD